MLRIVRLPGPRPFNACYIVYMFSYLACNYEMSGHSIFDLFIFLIFLCLDISCTHSLSLNNNAARAYTHTHSRVCIRETFEFGLRFTITVWGKKIGQNKEERNWPLPTSIANGGVWCALRVQFHTATAQIHTRIIQFQFYVCWTNMRAIYMYSLVFIYF